MNGKYRWSVVIAGGAVLMTLALVGNGQLWDQKADAQSIVAAAGESYVFLLEAGGQPMGEYAECSGLGSHNEVEEQATVTTRGTIVVRETAGALQWHRITLTRPTLGNNQVWSWRKTMEEMGQATALRDGRITLFRAGSTQPLAQWSFSRGWPASLVFNGDEEELVIVHEGLILGGTSSGGGTATRR